MRNRSLAGCAFFLLLLLIPAALPGQDAGPTGTTAIATRPSPSLNLYLKVQIDTAVKRSALKPGDVVEGRLSRGVYSGERELFPAGVRVRLVVDRLEKRPRARNDHWPWAMQAFMPRHEGYPAFQSALLLAEGREVPLRVSLVSLAPELAAHATAGKPDGKPRTQPAALTATLQAALLKPDELPENAHTGPAAVAPSRKAIKVAAGTQVRVILLSSVSASKSRQGDRVQARLVEPLSAGGDIVLPEGSIFQGTVVRRAAPRMLSRSGSLWLSFSAVTTPGGRTEPIQASIAGVTLNHRSRTRVDSEGQLKGAGPGKTWVLTNFGVMAGISKGIDDGAQLLVEALVSTATDASTAGTTRIVAACASGLFMLTRHGRDIVLPKLTEIEIMLTRPALLPATGGNATAGASPSHPE